MRRHVLVCSGLLVTLLASAACVDVVALGRPCTADEDCADDDYRCLIPDGVCAPTAVVDADAGSSVDDEDGGDGGARDDAGPRADAGAARDGGGDAGAAGDGGGALDDAGPRADAGALDDAGLVEDAGPVDDAGPGCPATPLPTGCFPIDVPLVVVERGETICVDVVSLCGGQCSAQSAAASGEGVTASVLGGAQVQLAVVQAAQGPVAIDLVSVAVTTTKGDVDLEVVVVDAADYDLRFTGQGADALSPASWCPAQAPDDLRAFVPRGALHGLAIPVDQPLDLTSLYMATGAGVEGESAFTADASLQVACDFLLGGGVDTLASPGSIHAGGCAEPPSRVGGTLPRMRITAGDDAEIIGGLTTLSSMRFGRDVDGPSEPDSPPAHVDVRGRRLVTGADFEVRDAIVVPGAGATIFVESDVELRGPFASQYAGTLFRLGGDLLVDATAATFTSGADVEMIDRSSTGALQSDAQLADLLVVPNHEVLVDDSGTSRTVVVAGDVVVEGTLRVETGDTLRILSTGSLHVGDTGGVFVATGASLEVEGGYTAEPGAQCVVAAGGAATNSLGLPLCPTVTPI